MKSMKERPILFSTPMVKAILEGRKTVTRRIIATQPDDSCYFEMKLHASGIINETVILTIDYNQGNNNPRVKCPYGKVGDRLWVKETFTIIDYWAGSVQVMYEDGDTLVRLLTKSEWNKFMKWQDRTERKPSIFMFRSLSRMALGIVSIGVERLQDITEEDAIREGVQENICGEPNKCISSLCKDGCVGKGEYYRYPVNFDDLPCDSAVESFQTLWQSINGKESWNTNPWVWVINFKKI